MTDRELLQQALDALEIQVQVKRVKNVIEAIRTRLAQPEPDWRKKIAIALHYPECWDTACYDTLESAIYETVCWSGCSTCNAAQPEPEPVAWMEIENYLDEENLWDERKVLLEYDNGKAVPLYTAPPKKEWVGLTDEEIKEVFYAAEDGYLFLSKAIEAKLKEKNHE